MQHLKIDLNVLSSQLPQINLAVYCQKKVRVHSDLSQDRAGLGQLVPGPTRPRPCSNPPKTSGPRCTVNRVGYRAGPCHGSMRARVVSGTKNQFTCFVCGTHLCPHTYRTVLLTRRRVIHWGWLSSLDFPVRSKGLSVAIFSSSVFASNGCIDTYFPTLI